MSTNCEREFKDYLMTLPAAMQATIKDSMARHESNSWVFWKAAWDSQQARIDALMLEHCPDEMTVEQMAEWAKHQVAAPGFDEAALDAALKAERSS